MSRIKVKTSDSGQGYKDWSKVITTRQTCRIPYSKWTVRDGQIGDKWWAKSEEEGVDVCRSGFRGRGLVGGLVPAHGNQFLPEPLCQSRRSLQQTVSRGSPPSPLISTFFNTQIQNSHVSVKVTIFWNYGKWVWWPSGGGSRARFCPMPPLAFAQFATSIFQLSFWNQAIFEKRKARFVMNSFTMSWFACIAWSVLSKWM